MLVNSADKSNSNNISKKIHEETVCENDQPEESDREQNTENSSTETISSSNNADASNCGLSSEIPSTALEMLSKLFPEKKKSVLELVLRRCGDDLLKAIEQCNPLKDGLNCFKYDCLKKHGKESIEKLKNIQIGR